MVAIRLARTGAKKRPSYRVVVTDKRRPRDSRSIEIVGFYNPRLDPIELSLKRERIEHWLGVGAQPSDTVKRLIKRFDEHGATGPESRASYVPVDVPEEQRPSAVAAAAAKVEADKAEAAAAEAKAEADKAEAEKAEAEKAEAGGAEAASGEEATSEEPAAEAPKAEAAPEAEAAPKAEAAPEAEAAPKAEAAVEEPKKEEKASE